MKIFLALMLALGLSACGRTDVGAPAQEEVGAASSTNQNIDAATAAASSGESSLPKAADPADSR